MKHLKRIFCLAVIAICVAFVIKGISHVEAVNRLLNDVGLSQLNVDKELFYDSFDMGLARPPMKESSRSSTFHSPTEWAVSKLEKMDAADDKQIRSHLRTVQLHEAIMRTLLEQEKSVLESYHRRYREAPAHGARGFFRTVR